MGHVSGDELQSLLSPLSVDEFLKACAEQRPVFIKGTRDKFDRLFHRKFDESWTHSIFEQAAAREKQLKDSPVGLVRAIFSDDEAFLSPDNAILPETGIPPEQYRFFYAGGASVPVDQVRKLDSHIDQVLRAIELQLCLSGTIRAVSYYSPPGAGVCPHFDPARAIILQLSGSKTYRVGRQPAVPYAGGKGYVCRDGTLRYATPRGSLSNDGREEWELPAVDMTDLEEFHLEQGDLVFLPCGAVHETKASGSHSIGLTLAFPAPGFGTLFARVLERVLGDRPEWRHLPLAVAASERGAMPRELVDFFAARLGELRELLGRLQPNGLELNASWCEQTWVPSDPAAPPAQVEIRRTDVLEVVRTADFGCAVGQDVHGRMGMHIYVNNDDLEIEEAWVPFFRKLVGADKFVAADALAWGNYDWDEAAEYLGHLVARGVLRRAAQPKSDA
jgi:hypothetical protein